jgi:hypothetical protein
MQGNSWQREYFAYRFAMGCLYCWQLCPFNAVADGYGMVSFPWNADLSSANGVLEGSKLIFSESTKQVSVSKYKITDERITMDKA